MFRIAASQQPNYHLILGFLLVSVGVAWEEKLTLSTRYQDHSTGEYDALEAQTKPDSKCMLYRLANGAEVSADHCHEPLKIWEGDLGQLYVLLHRFQLAAYLSALFEVPSIVDRKGQRSPQATEYEYWQLTSSLDSNWCRLHRCSRLRHL